MAVFTGQTVLAFVPHPDDEFASSGTLAKLARAGNRCVIAVATDGSKGTHDPECSPQQIVEIRREEMELAARELGCEAISLGFEDGTLEFRLADLKRTLFRTIRQYKPYVVITHDGWRKWELHSDHRTLGQAVCEAAYLADGCWFYPEQIAEGWEPHRVEEIFLVRSDEPNYWSDVTETFKQKVIAAAYHESQQRAGFWRNAPAASAIEKVEQRIQRMMERSGQDPNKEPFRRVRGTEVEI